MFSIKITLGSNDFNNLFIYTVFSIILLTFNQDYLFSLGVCRVYFLLWFYPKVVIICAQ